MTEKLSVKFLFLLAFIYALYVGYSALTASNILGLKATCEEAATDYMKYAANKLSPEAKAAATIMQTTCKAMGQQGEIYLKSLGLEP